MQKRPLLLLYLLPFTLSAQQVTVNGFVKNRDNRERLIGVNIWAEGSPGGTATNEEGFYSLTLPAPADSIRIHFSYIGFQPLSRALKASAQARLDVELSPGLLLEEVKVTSAAGSKAFGVDAIRLPVSTIHALPSLTGEADVLRAFQLMPGVQGGREGNSALNVRGGSPDQNLVLLDGIPLYNVNHIGGFISVFDVNAIQDVTLIKGGFPARYGGRLSSVLDIQMKEGNRREKHGALSLGPLASNVHLEGPLKNGKTTYQFSGRRSFMDLFSRLFSRLQNGGGFGAGYTIYDLNAKLTHHFSPGDKLTFTAYSGRDRLFIRHNTKKESSFLGRDAEFQFKARNEVKWGNSMAALKWTHIYTPKLIGNTQLAYTRFFYETNFENEATNLTSGEIASASVNRLRSSIDQLSLLTKLDYFLSPNHTIVTGANLQYHFFRPNTLDFREKLIAGGEVDNHYKSRVRALESNLYVENQLRLGSKLEGNLGLHFSSYHLAQSGTAYYSLQPRLLLDYHLSPRLSLKGTYTLMQQNLHLLSNTGGGLPTDLWVPATERVAPQKAWQTSLGATFLIDEHKGIGLTLEGYYKKMHRLIAFKEGASFFTTGVGWEDKVEGGGGGESAGLEFLLRKNKGRTTGWLAYTLSRSTRQFETLNGGRPFPYRFDRRYSLSFVLNHDFSERSGFSIVWVYDAGNAITLATQKHALYTLGIDQSLYLWYDYAEAHLYNGRNNYRMPDYHRLDFVFHLHKPKKNDIRTWTLGLYNAYSRLNPYFLFYDRDEQGELGLYQFSLFPLVPIVSWRFKF